MSIKNSLPKKLSLKTIVIAILVLVALGGVYSIIAGKSGKTTSNEEVELLIKETGLDQNKKVNNIGDVEKVIIKWVETNPEAIIQSVMAMQQRASEQQQQSAQKNISTRKDDLFNHKNTPQHAPRGYDVSIVEFFDYNCGYCKKAQSAVEKLMNEDRKVRIIFKELPILGASSTELSKVALAVNIVSPQHYVKFHNALMQGSARTREEALNIAKNLGLDVAKIRSALESKNSKIEDQIKFNQKLASSIGVNGTPGFVIGDELIPGMVELSVLKEKVANQRR
jgi:protein-disulfide isomerase